MERVSTDSDAGPQSSVGVGVADVLYKGFHEAQPNWLVDGFGLRGPQRDVTPEVVTPHPMPFGLPSGDKGGEGGGDGGPCNPTAPPDLVNNYVWGTIAGNCQWIGVCPATCP